MLVLSRKAGESLVFPALDIEVTVLEIERDRVRIGISGDTTHRVFRDELWERMPQEDKQDAVPGFE